jgi:serine/threonine-protein kinase
VVPGLDTAQGESSQSYPVAVDGGRFVLYASWRGGGTESVRIGALSVASGRTSILDLPAVTPLGMLGDLLVAVTVNNNIIVTPVDLGDGRVTGPPVTVESAVVVGAGGIAKAALSPSGSLIYLSGTRESDMVLVSLDGRTERTVLADRRGYAFPRYSPDGSRVAVTVATGVSRDVWIYDVRLSSLTRFSSGGVVNERPEWTPDGKRVLYRTDRGARSSIWWQPADMSAPAEPLLEGGARAYFEAVITPDGKSVVFQNDVSGADIEYRHLEGDTTIKAIIATQAVENRMRLSPDGRWIAYVTEESGTAQVVVQPFPGPGPRVNVSGNGGTEPVWSHDGRALFWRGEGQIMAAELVTTGGLSITSRRALFEDRYLRAINPHADYDAAPDGSGLLFLRGVNQQRLIMVQNWVQELKERLGAR